MRPSGVGSLLCVPVCVQYAVCVHTCGPLMDQTADDAGKTCWSNDLEEASRDGLPPWGGGGWGHRYFFLGG